MNQKDYRKFIKQINLSYKQRYVDKKTTQSVNLKYDYIIAKIPRDSKVDYDSLYFMTLRAIINHPHINDSSNSKLKHKITLMLATHNIKWEDMINKQAFSCNNSPFFWTTTSGTRRPKPYNYTALYTDFADQLASYGIGSK